MKVVAKTDIGLVRSSNEDTYSYIQKDENNFIAFVCDGMGGHLGGAYASHKAIEIINAEYAMFDPKNPPKNMGVWLFNTLQKANNAVYEQSLEDENLKGMGTTVTGIIMVNGVINYAHIGDSRIYVYDEESILQITTDHTYVNSLLLNGIITYKQAAKHSGKHILTNALGIKKDVSVDIGSIKLKENEGIFICSDGLHNLIDGKKLQKALNEHNENLQDKIDALDEKALALGGTDNITMIIIEQ